jgi:hypothetical protein
MNAVRILLAAVMACKALSAGSQQNVNIRGTLTGFDGRQLSVKTREGRDVQIELPDSVNVSATRAFTLADVRPGMVLGVTTVKKGNAVVAIDVRPIPPTARQGLSPFDLQPESTMTNASLEGTVAQVAGGNELTLNYQSGTVKVLVPPGTPMSQSAPGTRADLKTRRGHFRGGEARRGRQAGGRARASGQGRRAAHAVGRMDAL